MKRTLDSSKFNIIANDPDVKSLLGSVDEIDTTPLVSNPNNICLMTDAGDGGYILHNQGGGMYVAHTLAKKAARGKAMYNLMQEGFAYLFLKGDALEVSTFCPDDNERALKWAYVSGFKDAFRGFQNIGERVPGQFLSITFQQWVMTAPNLIEEGQAFHYLIEATQGHENHPEDEAHDRMVGATILAIKAGNMAKAILLYNRWATVAGYHPSTILSMNPPVLNIGNAILTMNDGSIEILKVFEGTTPKPLGE